MPMYREYRCELCGRPLFVKDVVLSGRITCDDTLTHQRLAELSRGQTADSEATNADREFISTVELLMDAAQCVLDPEGFDVHALSRMLQTRAGVLQRVISQAEEDELIDP